jgi:hypothetical protein
MESFIISPTFSLLPMSCGCALGNLLRASRGQVLGACAYSVEPPYGLLASEGGIICIVKNVWTTEI